MDCNLITQVKKVGEMFADTFVKTLFDIKTSEWTVKFVIEFFEIFISEKLKTYDFNDINLLQGYLIQLKKVTSCDFTVFKKNVIGDWCRVSTTVRNQIGSKVTNSVLNNEAVKAAIESVGFFYGDITLFGRGFRTFYKKIDDDTMLFVGACLDKINQKTSLINSLRIY